jgi:hypothetical protein
MVDIYDANQEELAKSIDDYFNNKSIYDNKQKAIEIGFNNFSVKTSYFLKNFIKISRLYFIFNSQ